VEKSKDVDIVVCCGDLSNFGEDYESSFKLMKKIEKPILIVPGNHEKNQFIDELCAKHEKMKNVHGSFYKFDDITFIGCGGASLSPFETPHELTGKKFKDIFDKLQEFVNESSKAVFIGHEPPSITTLDFIEGVGHVGNMRVREFLEKNADRIVLGFFGHIHECAGKEDMIKKTRIINPGKNGKIIDL
jgi:hypothetical protein